MKAFRNTSPTFNTIEDPDFWFSHGVEAGPSWVLAIKKKETFNVHLLPEKLGLLLEKKAKVKINSFGSFQCRGHFRKFRKRSRNIEVN